MLALGIWFRRQIYAFKDTSDLKKKQPFAGGSVVGVMSHSLKSCRFYAWSEHIVKLWVQSLVRVCRRQLINLSLSLSLSSINVSFSEKKKQQKEAVRHRCYSNKVAYRVEHTHGQNRQGPQRNAFAIITQQSCRTH